MAAVAYRQGARCYSTHLIQGMRNFSSMIGLDTCVNVDILLANKRSWNMLRDERTGRTILLSKNNNEASQVRNDDIANPSLMPRRLFSDYHNPSPLSERQAQRSSSSPHLLELEYGSPDTQDVASTPFHRPAFGLDSSRYDPPLASDLNRDVEVAIKGSIARLERLHHLHNPDAYEQHRAMIEKDMKGMEELEEEFSRVYGITGHDNHLRSYWPGGGFGLLRLD